ncbi:MAG: helix-hairpin-helix domain-containing protein [Saprospiraceae bacterium]|nr:helix-hairpin-helix domain-containing protein [Saprospiraceae bacterium]
MHPNCIALCMLILPSLLYGQVPETAVAALEAHLYESGLGEAASSEALYDHLQTYARDPLHLNRATAEDFRQLGLLSERQIRALMAYRQLAGPLIALEELQAVPEMDLPTIRMIYPFVYLEGDAKDYREPFVRMLKTGRRELQWRWSRILQAQKGYGPRPGKSRYEGSPDQLLFRFRHRHGRHLSYGFTGEKDRGEAFFSGSNPGGFDFYSGHFFFAKPGSRLRSLVVGDYRVSFGQGLLMHSGFSYGKSARAIQIKKGSRPLRPYRSAGEAEFHRGLAAEISLHPEWRLTAFASRRKRDANLVYKDEQEASHFSSLRLDGYHRSQSEIADEKSVRLWQGGCSIRYHGNAIEIGINSLFHRFGRPWQRRPSTYNHYYFRGDELLNASLDYSFERGSIHIFGETALSHNGGWASLNGLMLGLGQRYSLAFLHRYFTPRYQVISPNAFAETGNANNEHGIYLGFEWYFKRRWTLSSYFDLWRHPWWRYRVDGPSDGWEFRSRLTYRVCHQWQNYLEIRAERKEWNAPSGHPDLQGPIPHRRFHFRIHLGHEMDGGWEWRSRIDWGFAQNAAEGYHWGWLILQDILFRPMESTLSFTARMAYFNTDDYDIRFYHYENSLLHSFSISPYYQRGLRGYVNLRYRGIPHLTLEGRFAISHWFGRTSIGSGLEEIQGNSRSRVSGQVIYRFSR